ncbi:MAG: type III-B CRISPR module RAMP protein Cmr4 [Candidatus Edwardsbacteria bacterium]|nr:type III-B CRISPR module RAMP protein Cmr4 [Candidatus Edwardsbacteria bacterium]
MYRKAKPFFLVCETPLHCGSGGDLGLVDLPIQRERHTEFPKIESSSLKGGLREAFEEKLGRSDERIRLAFGPEDGGDHAGALGFTDARLLLFPVKSMKGVFAWITCRAVIERFKADLMLAKIDPGFEVPVDLSTPNGCALFVKDDKVVLEEYTFTVAKKADPDCTKLSAWIADNAMPQGAEYKFWRDKVKYDLVVLGYDEFRDFVLHSTEVITRTKINNDTGTVQTGALFTEEYLPPETVLYSLALTTPIFSKDKGSFEAKDGKDEETQVMEFFTRELPSVIQLGGNATIGKGIIRTRIEKEAGK